MHNVLLAQGQPNTDLKSLCIINRISFTFQTVLIRFCIVYPGRKSNKTLRILTFRSILALEIGNSIIISTLSIEELYYYMLLFGFINKIFVKFVKQLFPRAVALHIIY